MYFLSPEPVGSSLLDCLVCAPRWYASRIIVLFDSERWHGLTARIYQEADVQLQLEIPQPFLDRVCLASRVEYWKNVVEIISPAEVCFNSNSQ